MSSAYCIGIAALFDFLDGLVARLLKVHSEIGKQLDSLADMVTFGVLPSFIMFQYLSAADAGNWKFIAFAIAVFSAFRLAKFNVDTRQSDQFIGLPTPANAIFICSLIFLKDIPGFDFLFEKTALSIVVTIFSLLLVAEIPMIALKFKSLKFKENIFRYILILGAITLVVLFQFSGIPFVIAFYILLSVVNNIVASRN
jgi:CDP-diacylglycerol--serine O-phosphatidyltransferase